jgi:hypothetical protein
MFTALQEYMLRWCPVPEVRKKVVEVKEEAIGVK